MSDNVPSYIPMFQREQYKADLEQKKTNDFLWKYRKTQPGALLHHRSVPNQREVVRSYLKFMEVLDEYKSVIDPSDIHLLKDKVSKGLFRGDAAEIDKVLDFVVRKLES